MGNASGKEEGAIEGGGPSGRSVGDDALGNGVGSADAMGNTPPDSPRRSQSPLIFAPQIPVAPLQGAVGIPIFNQSSMNDSHGHSDLPPEKGIPTMITWNYGGNDVAVEGSWDNWTSRRVMQSSGKDHFIVLVLPSGVYQYRFIVDGEWRYIPDLPTVANEIGHVMNLLDMHDYVPENLDTAAEFEAPPSPDSSYSQPYPVDEDFAKEPSLVPPQLHLTVLGGHNGEASTKPQHVVLNHLFIEKGWTSQSLVALGLTHRFQSKYVTVVLYKPLKR
uniref:SNF1-related protein kinase regulatory subunit beta-1 n=2 Tax=Anthurium amnicola TaxID=1678845 RepID=A0A1D1XN63_9ARAE